MSAAPPIRPRTVLFARVLGPYLLVVVIAAVLHSTTMNAMVTAFETNTDWSWMAGAFVLPMGLTVVALHPFWRGAPAAIVSVLGWIITAKGVALMIFPQESMSLAHSAVTSTVWWQVAMIGMALVGLYLTVVGWIGTPDRSEANAHDGSRHLRPAA